jgi:hypothetical protein
MTEETTIDTPKLLMALDLIHPPSEWAGFEELRIGGGFAKDSLQRIDYWAINYKPSRQNKAVSYEIKASRSDFFNEIKKPRKRKAALRLSNEYYFVCPKGMVTIEEIPPECGLMEVDHNGVLTTVVKAPFRNTIPPTFNFLATVCRRLDKNRKTLYDHIRQEDGKLKMYGNISLEVIQTHIDRWKSFNTGNKEVPDQIADALSKCLIEIKDIIKESKRK